MHPRFRTALLAALAPWLIRAAAAAVLLGPASVETRADPDAALADLAASLAALHALAESPTGDASLMHDTASRAPQVLAGYGFARDTIYAEHTHWPGLTQVTEVPRNAVVQGAGQPLPEPDMTATLAPLLVLALFGGGGCGAALWRAKLRPG